MQLCSCSAHFAALRLLLSVYSNYRELERLQVIETSRIRRRPRRGAWSSRSPPGRRLRQRTGAGLSRGPVRDRGHAAAAGPLRNDELFFSGTGCILLGEEAAAETARWLELVARSDSLRLDTSLFIVRSERPRNSLRKPAEKRATSLKSCRPSSALQKERPCPNIYLR